MELTPLEQAVVVALRRLRPARAACTPTAPESIWRVKDDRERELEEAIDNYISAKV